MAISLVANEHCDNLETLHRELLSKNRGHLGADADVTIHTPNENKEVMFGLPRYVIKSGPTIVEQGDIRHNHFGRTFQMVWTG